MSLLSRDQALSARDIALRALHSAHAEERAERARQLEHAEAALEQARNACLAYETELRAIGSCNRARAAQQDAIAIARSAASVTPLRPSPAIEGAVNLLQEGARSEAAYAAHKLAQAQAAVARARDQASAAGHDLDSWFSAYGPTVPGFPL